MSLSVQVGTNSFIATLKCHVDGSNCHLTLDDLKVSELSDMNVDHSGLPFFGHIFTWFEDYFYNVIEEVTETHCKDMVNYVIKDKKICEELFEDEIADHGRPTPSIIRTKPFPRVEILSTKPAHDKFTNLQSLSVPKSEGSSKKPHRITKNENDEMTKPLLQAENPTSTPQDRSQNIPSEDPSGDILEMIDNIPSMVDS